MRTTLSIAASIVLLALGIVAVFGLDRPVLGVDVAAVGMVVLVVGLASLTLVTLVWAARGPGAVQDPRARQHGVRQHGVRQHRVVPPRPRRADHDRSRRT